MTFQMVPALFLIWISVVASSTATKRILPVTISDPLQEDEPSLLQVSSSVKSTSDSRTNDKELETADDFSSFFNDFPNLQDFPVISEILRTYTTTPSPPPPSDVYHHHPIPGYVPRHQQLLDRPDITSRMPSSISHEPNGLKESAGTPFLFPKPRQKVSNEETPKAEDFPKIFRFNNDRVNIADFDHLKKVQKSYNSLSKGDSLDPERLQRNKFLILHGGVFNHEQPLTFARIYEAQSSPPKTVAHVYEYVPPEEKPRGYSFFYKTK